MKKLTLILAVLLMAAPAMAAVSITVTDLGGGVAAIEYTSDVNVVAFGLDITVTAGTITGIDDFFVGDGNGFGIFPGAFAVSIDPEDPNWDEPNYTPLAPVGAAGALGGLGTDGITIEMGTLYESGGAPASSGRLCTLQVSESCNMCVAVNATRCGQTLGDDDAGVVLEDGTAVVPTLGCTAIDVTPPGPPCWDWLTHCNGNATDASGGVGYVNLDDFIAFRDSYLKTYKNDWNDGAGPYSPCADFDNSGKVNLDDFIIFRDNYATTAASDCTPAAWPPPLID